MDAEKSREKAFDYYLENEMKLQQEFDEEIAKIETPDGIKFKVSFTNEDLTLFYDMIFHPGKQAHIKRSTMDNLHKALREISESLKESKGV